MRSEVRTISLYEELFISYHLFDVVNLLTFDV